jgi:hypothetical protein
MNLHWPTSRLANAVDEPFELVGEQDSGAANRRCIARAQVEVPWTGSRWYQHVNLHALAPDVLYQAAQQAGGSGEPQWLGRRSRRHTKPQGKRSQNA